VCGRDVAVRKGGLAREHRRDPDLAIALGLQLDKICPGSGRKVRLR
jgi:hypothetical protein